MESFYEVFSASARKIAGLRPAETAFEKFHVLTLDYRTPVIVSLLYVLVVSYFSKLNRQQAAASGSRGKKQQAGKGAASESGESRFTPFKCLVILHNVVLCVYSAVTFLSIIPILLKPYFSESILTAFCDVDKTTFRSGVNFWVWNFYVSKYYELSDTAILLLKGKPSSFLQTFHHSGSIIGMWVMTITHAPAAWIFVLFNSFIHTVMYFYYTLTCFGYRPSWKRVLTSMQIVQFLVGNPLGIVYALMPGCFPPEILPPENIIGKVLGSQARSLYACLVVNTFFISSLVVLFTDFSRKAYGSAAAKSPKAVKNTKTPKGMKDIKKPKSDSKADSPLPALPEAKTSRKSKSKAKQESATAVQEKEALISTTAKSASKKSARGRSLSPTKSAKSTKFAASTKSRAASRKRS